MLADELVAESFRFDPYSPATDANPFPAYKRLRDEFPAFWCEEAGMWVLSRYDDILRALQDWRTYSSARGNLVDELPGRAGATLGSSDPPRHDRLRALIQKAMLKSALTHLVDPLRASAHELAREARERGSFDFVSDFSARLTLDLIYALFALPEEGGDEVRDKAVLMAQTDPVLRGKNPAQIAAYEWMADYAGRLVEARKRNPGDDLLSNFITAEIDGEKLRDNEVQLTVTTLIMAGIESLSGFLSMLGFNLATYPEARRALAANSELIPDAIEESLRFNTSAQRFRRALTCDVELHGEVMKAGAFVMLCYGSANRDERKFVDPDRYDILRKPKAHLGFGGGVHACLGSALARLACKVAAEELLAVMPDFTLAEHDFPWLPSSNFRSPQRLLLAVR
ncbi:cytochrome P450 [Altererythrobacter salegens]|uniref:Cytochrome P450 n=1 Tax=Croceibacterium salegens TaxID=1737568 RepID=A0A6I4T2V2_9SPHN|nr:cytochrome P450 [Croceibacterium salegens]MXO60982.1 cytochrome P450 [Croceibacterium salegens]